MCHLKLPCKKYIKRSCEKINFFIFYLISFHHYPCMCHGHASKPLNVNSRVKDLAIATTNF